MGSAKSNCQKRLHCGDLNHPCDWRSFVFGASRPVRRFQALRNWAQSVSKCFALWSRISNSSLKTRPVDSLGATLLIHGKTHLLLEERFNDWRGDIECAELDFFDFAPFIE